MAVLNVLVRRSPGQAWDVLADGWSYAEWVAGTRAIRAVDDGWPAEGTSLRYVLGRGPLTLQDRTTVRICEPGRRLEMEADAGRLGSARMSFEVLRWGDNCVLIFDEHPLSGPGALWHNVAVEGVMKVRNRRMLRTLAQLIERRHPR